MKRNDPGFEKEIGKAPTGTIHCINKMFESIDAKYFIKPIKAVRIDLKKQTKKNLTKLINFQ